MPCNLQTTIRITKQAMLLDVSGTLQYLEFELYSFFSDTPQSSFTVEDIKHKLLTFERNLKAEDLVEKARARLECMNCLSTSFAPTSVHQVTADLPFTDHPTNSSAASLNGDERYLTADEDSESPISELELSKVTSGSVYLPDVVSGMVSQSPSTSPVASCSHNFDPVEQLAVVFPNIDKSHLHEYLDLANGDIQWASSLLLEGGINFGQETRATESTGPPTMTIPLVEARGEKDQNTGLPNAVDEPTGIPVSRASNGSSAPPTLEVSADVSTFTPRCTASDLNVNSLGNSSPLSVPISLNSFKKLTSCMLMPVAFRPSICLRRPFQILFLTSGHQNQSLCARFIKASCIIWGLSMPTYTRRNIRRVDP
ncbi:hypothetical protein AHF37_09840 [Paragonimus kellicotti]|nr:hypothetical protein AHF37_09840 [Paragonimus kellicotti]